ncbi:MAG: AEC family transporter [Oscillospiraceae bacterium]|nr:AEC family transporter [Oscillospiraceae bacterium]
MLFFATLSQMGFLFLLMAAGYALVKLRLVPEHSQTLLSILEKYIFIPALVFGTFAENFTPDRLSSAWRLLALSAAVLLVAIPLGFVSIKFCAKDRYTRNVYWYAMSFANFSFMGNAVVEALFPELFMEYILFGLMMWVFIYLWGIPSLLMDEASAKSGVLSKLKNLLNPMFICMLIGMAVGLAGIKVPQFILNAVNAAKGCMSPAAMMLTGMAIAEIDLAKVLKKGSIYYITALRLLVFPLLFLALTAIFGASWDPVFIICATITLAMPIGMNTIVIPSAYGKDTTLASGMVLVSHVLSCASIPVIFWLMEKVIG